MAPTHIAVVDDDRPVRTALARLLVARSFVATAYESGPQFIASLKTSVPDCLLLDVQMPEMDGIELLNYLTYSGFRIPTIIFTAHDDPFIRDQCLAAGAAAFLFKPIAEAGLIGAINEAVTRQGTPSKPCRSLTA
jgi:FixJ family two-component response regulator